MSASVMELTVCFHCTEATYRRKIPLKRFHPMWTLKAGLLTQTDEKRIESAELWIYRWMLRVSWTEHRTDESIPTELNTTRQLLSFVVRRKLSFFGHTIRDGGCELVVRDQGESEREAKAWKTKDVIQQ